MDGIAFFATSVTLAVPEELLEDVVSFALLAVVVVFGVVASAAFQTSNIVAGKVLGTTPKTSPVHTTFAHLEAPFPCFFFGP